MSIRSSMKSYPLYELGSLDSYGQLGSPNLVGEVELDLQVYSHSQLGSPLYENCEFIGLTLARDLSDKNLIEVEGKKLKVLFVNSQGRYTQIFLRRFS